MNNLLNPLRMTLFFLFIFSSSAISGEYTAHVHGQAELTIAFEQERINFSLVAPAETLFGFEHGATSDNELATVAASKKYLSRYDNITQFDDGECLVKSVEIDTGDITNIAPRAHQHSHASSHAEVKVSYQLNCRNIKNITLATVRLFDYYPALEKVHVMWLGYSQQGSIALNANNARISFK